MGFRFKKSIKIAPGVKLNLNKKSASVSIGTKGMRKTYSTTGRKTTTVGLPGTGLSYSTSSGSKKSASKKSKSSASRTNDSLASAPKPKKRMNRFKIAMVLWGIAVIGLFGSFSSPEHSPAEVLPGAILFFIIGFYFYKTKDKYKNEEVQNEIIETQTDFSDDEYWTDDQDFSESFYLAGAKFRQGDFIKALAKSGGQESGDSVELQLLPDSANEYDKNAIKVIWFGEFVGFVPAEIAPKVKIENIYAMDWELVKPNSQHNYYTLYIDLNA